MGHGEAPGARPGPRGCGVLIEAVLALPRPLASTVQPLTSGLEAQVWRGLERADQPHAAPAAAPVGVTAAICGQEAARGEVAAEAGDQETGGGQHQDLPPAQPQPQAPGVSVCPLDLEQGLDDVLILCLRLVAVLRWRGPAHEGVNLHPDVTITDVLIQEVILPVLLLLIGVVIIGLEVRQDLRGARGVGGGVSLLELQWAGGCPRDQE